MTITPSTRTNLNNSKTVRVLDVFAGLDLGEVVLTEPRRLLNRYHAIVRRERQAPTAVATSVDQLANQISSAPGDTVDDDIDAALGVLAAERSHSAIVEQTVSVLATAAHHTAARFLATMRTAGEPLLALLDDAAVHATADLGHALNKTDPTDTDRSAMLGARPAREARASAHQALARLDALTDAWRLLNEASLIRLGPLRYQLAHPDDLAEFRFENPIAGRTLVGWSIDDAARIVDAAPRFLNTRQHAERDAQLQAADDEHRVEVARAVQVLDKARRGGNVQDAVIANAQAVVAADPETAGQIERTRNFQSLEQHRSDGRVGDQALAAAHSGVSSAGHAHRL